LIFKNKISWVIDCQSYDYLEMAALIRFYDKNLFENLEDHVCGHSSRKSTKKELCVQTMVQLYTFVTHTNPQLLTLKKNRVRPITGPDDTLTNYSKKSKIFLGRRIGALIPRKIKAKMTPLCLADSNNLTTKYFQLRGGAFYSRSLPPTQQSCAALQKISAGERHTNTTNLLQRSRYPIRVPSTLAFAHAPPTHQAHRAPNHTSALFTS
jgi:transcriptional antiterminator Rof (Rho-off)